MVERPERLDGLEGLNKAYDAIMAGDPQSLADGGKAFEGMYKALNKTPEDTTKEGQNLLYTEKWKGPAADAFSIYMADFGNAINKAAGPLKEYKTELDNAHDALDKAQKDIKAYLTQANTAVKQDLNNKAKPDYKGWNAGGNQILTSLANEYTRIIPLLVEVTVPEILGGDGDDGDGKGDGKKGKDGDGDGDGKKGKGDDGDGKGDDKKGDGKGDDKKGGGEEGDGKGGGGEKGGGEGGDGKKGGGEGGGSGTGEGKGTDASDPGGGGSGGGGKHDGTSASDPYGSGGGSKHGTPASDPYGSGGGPGTPAGIPGGYPARGGTIPIDNNHRILPGTPTVTKRGVQGIDVDHDGEPDIGMDGKPLPDAEEVTYRGVRGIDVDGDGKPDIGPDGEITRFAQIVRGPDGTIGVDINGDFKPDIAISGQVLPDAHIVDYHGFRGLDINGDCKPDIGMDGRPTPWAPLTTHDGVRGVDVNGDCKPDIGMDGQITQWAPKATDRHGIVGIDVNDDGKPDIATAGGQQATQMRGAAAIASPRIPDSVSSAGDSISPATPPPPFSYSPLSHSTSGSGYGSYDTSTSLTGDAVVAPLPGSSYTAQGIGSQYGVGTTLTGGATSEARGSVPAQSSPGPTPTPYLAGTAGMAGMAGMTGGMTGSGGRGGSPLGRTNFVEDADVWDDGDGAASELGRPSG